MQTHTFIQIKICICYILCMLLFFLTLGINIHSQIFIDKTQNYYIEIFVFGKILNLHHGSCNFILSNYLPEKAWKYKLTLRKLTPLIIIDNIFRQYLPKFSLSTYLWMIVFLMVHCTCYHFLWAHITHIKLFYKFKHLSIL